jgi:hypothetical protein
LLFFLAEAGSLISSLHQAGAATCENVDSFPPKISGKCEAIRILLCLRLDTRAAEYANTIKTILIELTEFVLDQHGTLVEEPQPFVEVFTSLSSTSSTNHAS